MSDQNQNPLLSSIPPEDEQFVSGDGFLAAESAPDWDALLNRGNVSNANAPMSKWERDSLYVKFDPLVTSRNLADHRNSFIFKAPMPPGGALPPPPPPPLFNEDDEDAEIEKCTSPSPSSPPLLFDVSGNGSKRSSLSPSSSPLLNKDADKRSSPSSPLLNKDAGKRSSPSSPLCIRKEDADRRSPASPSSPLLTKEADKRSSLSLSPSSSPFLNKDAGKRSSPSSPLFSKKEESDKRSSASPSSPLLKANGDADKRSTPPTSPLFNENEDVDKRSSLTTSPLFNENGVVDTPPPQFNENEDDDNERHSSPPAPPPPLLNETAVDGKRSSTPTEEMQQLERIASLKRSIADLKQECEKQDNMNRRTITNREFQLNGLVDECQRVQDLVKAKQEEKQMMIDERDEARADLRQMESGFAKMLLMYEDVKNCQAQVEENIEVLKEREEALMHSLRKRDERNATAEDRYHEVLETMSRDFDARIKEREQENAKLRAKLRMSDMRNSKMEGEIQQIDIENGKLRAFCDELTK